MMREDFLAGVRFWAEVAPNKTVRVYRYVGKHYVDYVYYFEPVKSRGPLISKHITQLNSENFRPFLLDTARIRETLYGKENPHAPF